MPDPSPSQDNNAALDLSEVKTPKVSEAEHSSVSKLDRKLLLGLAGVGALIGYAFSSIDTSIDPVVELAQSPDLAQVIQRERLQLAVKNAVKLESDVFLVRSSAAVDLVVSEFEKQYSSLIVNRTEASNLVINIDSESPVPVAGIAHTLYVSQRK